MFFRKKIKADLAFNGQAMAQAFVQVAIMLYREVGQPDGSSDVVATVNFDEDLKVSSVDNFLLNGLPKVPSPEVIEAINQNLAILAAPVEYRPKALSIEVKNGEVNTTPAY